VTGVNSMTDQLGSKRLALLHELLPLTTRFGLLYNSNTANIDVQIAAARTAAEAMGGQIEAFPARTYGEIDDAFEQIAHRQIDALFLTTGSPFNERLPQLAMLAMRYRMPSISGYREAV